MYSDNGSLESRFAVRSDLNRHRLIRNDFQKNLRVRQIFCPQFRGRKWLRQFYGRLENCVLSAGKTHVHKIPPFRGGYFGFWGGGVPILFLWARGFF